MPRAKGAGHEPIPPLLPESAVLSGTLAALQLFGPALEFDRNNVGGMHDPGTGRYVRYGRAGDLDVRAMVRKGPNAGKTLLIETKRGGFDPQTATGEERERFGRQLARMRETNAGGGLAFWVRDPSEVAPAVQKILAGCQVEIDEDGWPYVTDEPSGGRDMP